MVGPAVKREAVAYLQAGHGLSERRACRIIGADRKMVRYQSRRAPDTKLRGRLRELANERRRFGYPLPGRVMRSMIPRGGGCSFCFAAKANLPASTGSIGSTAKKA